MRQEVPARALARRSQIVLSIGIVVVLLGILMITVHGFMRTVPFVIPSSDFYGIYTSVTTLLLWLGGGVIVVGVLAILRASTWKRDNPVAEQIGTELEQFLDTRYIYIRNVSKFRIGYVDAVLVGPPGVLAFRVVKREGVFFNEGVDWMQQLEKGNWKVLNWSPTKDCVADVRKLRTFFEKRGMVDVPVFAVVTFTDDAPATIVTTEKPVVPVLQPNELAFGLDNTYFSKKDRIDQLTANKIAKLLLR